VALLTDDQKMLRETASSFLAGEGAISKQLRRWRDTGCTDGFGTDLWKQFGELGLTGICIPQEQGGLGLGTVEAALVLEEIGRNLTPSPFLTTAVAAARALEGTAHGERWFPGILSGETVLALAVDESRRHAPEQTALAAERRGNGFLLNGAKQFVVHGNSADMILTVARTAGSPGELDGLTLFAVPKGTAEVESVNLTDSSKAARLKFENVELDVNRSFDLLSANFGMSMDQYRKTGAPGPSIDRFAKLLNLLGNPLGLRDPQRINEWEIGTREAQPIAGADAPPGNMPVQGC